MPTIDPDSTGFIERRAPNGHYRWAADGQLAQLLRYMAHHPGEPLRLNVPVIFKPGELAELRKQVKRPKRR